MNEITVVNPYPMMTTTITTTVPTTTTTSSSSSNKKMVMMQRQNGTRNVYNKKEEEEDQHKQHDEYTDSEYFFNDSFTSRTETLTLRSSFYSSLNQSIPDDLELDDSFSSSLPPLQLPVPVPQSPQSQHEEVEVEEQREEFHVQNPYHANNTHNQREQEEPFTSSSDDEDDEGMMIDVRPGHSIPVLSAARTWDAVLDGRVTVANCSGCSLDLHCNLHVSHVICPECGIITELEENSSSPSSDNDAHRRCCASIGVTSDFILNWTRHGSNNINNNMNQENQTSSSSPVVGEESKAQVEKNQTDQNLNIYDRQQRASFIRRHRMSVGGFSELILEWTAAANDDDSSDDEDDDEQSFA